MFLTMFRPMARPSQSRTGARPSISQMAPCFHNDDNHIAHKSTSVQSRIPISNSVVLMRFVFRILLILKIFETAAARPSSTSTTTISSTFSDSTTRPITRTGKSSTTESTTTRPEIRPYFTGKNALQQFQKSKKSFRCGFQMKIYHSGDEKKCASECLKTKGCEGFDWFSDNPTGCYLASKCLVIPVKSNTRYAFKKYSPINTMANKPTTRFTKENGRNKKKFQKNKCSKSCGRELNRHQQLLCKKERSKCPKKKVKQKNCKNGKCLKKSKKRNESKLNRLKNRTLMKKPNKSGKKQKIKKKSNKIKSKMSKIELKKVIDKIIGQELTQQNPQPIPMKQKNDGNVEKLNAKNIESKVSKIENTKKSKFNSEKTVYETTTFGTRNVVADLQEPVKNKSNNENSVVSNFKSAAKLGQNKLKQSKENKNQMEISDLENIPSKAGVQNNDYNPTEKDAKVDDDSILAIDESLIDTDYSNKNDVDEISNGIIVLVVVGGALVPISLIILCVLLRKRKPELKNKHSNFKELDKTDKHVMSYSPYSD